MLFSTRPMRTAAGARPLAVASDKRVRVRRGCTAISSPPEVCGSYSIDSNSRSRSVAELPVAEGRSIRTRSAKCSRLEPMPPDLFAAAICRTPAKTGTRSPSTTSVTPLASAISLACPIKPKPGDVGAGVDGAARQRSAARLPPRGSASASTGRPRRHDVRGARSNLIAVPDDAGAERLGEKQHVTRLRAGVGKSRARDRLRR